MLKPMATLNAAKILITSSVPICPMETNYGANRTRWMLTRLPRYSGGKEERAKAVQREVAAVFGGDAGDQAEEARAMIGTNKNPQRRHRLAHRHRLTHRRLHRPNQRHLNKTTPLVLRAPSLLHI